MNDSFLMRVLQRLGNLLRNGQGLSNWNRAALDRIGQCFSSDQLHHEKVAAVDFLQSVNCGDVRMIQRCQYPCLTLETRNTFGIVAECFRKELDGNTAAE